MPAPHTNNGYKSEKPWRAALIRAVNRHVDGKGSPKKLERIADACADAGMDGEGWAIKEIGDRMDGKPVQGVEMAVNVQVTEIKRIIVQPGQVIDTEFEEVEPGPALEAPDA